MKNSLIFILLLLYGCQADNYVLTDPRPAFTTPVTPSKELQFAMKWYNENSYHIFELIEQFGGRHPLFNEMIPYWGQSFIESDERYIAVQMALITKTSRIFVLPENSNIYKITGDKRYLSAMTRLVILTDQEKEETHGFFMSILPSPEYLEKTNFRPFCNNNYLKKDKDFSGSILYHDLNGNQANGWIYENGKIKASLARPKQNIGEEEKQ